MRIVVLGATGGTGQELVRQALLRGHKVTALVRAPERLGIPGPELNIIKGDLLSRADLKQAIAGHDAVLSAFGPRERNSNGVWVAFAKNLVSAMMEARLARLLLVSTAFLFKDSIPAFIVGRVFFGQVVREAAEMERVITSSTLEWTIFRPPRLTNEPASGVYRIQSNHLPSFGFSISRAGAAEIMLQELEQCAYFRQIVGVSK